MEFTCLCCSSSSLSISSSTSENQVKNCRKGNTLSNHDLFCQTIFISFFYGGEGDGAQRAGTFSATRFSFPEHFGEVPFRGGEGNSQVKKISKIEGKAEHYKTGSVKVRVLIEGCLTSSFRKSVVSPSDVLAS